MEKQKNKLDLVYLEDVQLVLRSIDICLDDDIIDKIIDIIDALMERGQSLSISDIKAMQKTWDTTKVIGYQHDEELCLCH
jgi:hypothetical protein